MNWLDAEREYEDEVIGETTLGRLFEDAAERNANRPAQQYKGGVVDRSLTESVIPAAAPGEFRPLSYAEMRDIVRMLAAGFRDLGIERGDRVGLFANTRMEWAQCDFALLSAGAVVTTVYADSSPSKIEYLLDDPNARPSSSKTSSDLSTSSRSKTILTSSSSSRWIDSRARSRSARTC